MLSSGTRRAQITWTSATTGSTCTRRSGAAAADAVLLCRPRGHAGKFPVCACPSRRRCTTPTTVPQAAADASVWEIVGFFPDYRIFHKYGSRFARHLRNNPAFRLVLKSVRYSETGGLHGRDLGSAFSALLCASFVAGRLTPAAEHPGEPADHRGFLSAGGSIYRDQSCQSAEYCRLRQCPLRICSADGA